MSLNLEQTLAEVTLDDLLHQVLTKKQDGHRLVCLTCLCSEGGHDVLYHFDKNYALTTLRLHVPEGREVPSITGLYLGAVLLENEIKDFFGLSFHGMALDFQGRLFLTESAPKTPLNTRCGMDLDVRVPAARKEEATP